MTDIEIAIKQLEGHSICLCKNGSFFTDDGKGISPMMRFIAEGIDLKGYCVADQIVGKAAAILFVKAGFSHVHGKVMSKNGILFLNRHNIPYSYDTLTDKIVNRSNTGICPMEKTVYHTDDVEKGYKALVEKLAELSATS